MSHPDDTIAVLSVSPGRRLVGTTMQVLLSALLVWIWLTLPERTLISTVLLLGFGALVFWQAIRFFHATTREILLRPGGVYDSAGDELAELGNIASVDRGAFAFKPSNGFMIRLHAPRARAWQPGLWWRWGTRVGVGGATSGKAARDMADVITLVLKDADAARRFGIGED